MEDNIPQAVRNCCTCQQDLSEVEFQSVKNPMKFTGECASCRVRRRKRKAGSRAAVAAMRNIALRLSPRRATKRTDSLANLTPPRRTALTPASGLPRPLLGLSTLSAVVGPFSITSTLSLPIVVLGTPIPQTPIPQGTFPTASVFDQIVDPPFTGDLNLPALSEEDQAFVREFYTALTDDKMYSCICC
ncbi:hypothetical protein EDB80DRAFT_756798 [Ilyonectria destructans]|nr:hypothetical protein EDB80DRAFT_756798 [Ilyonectria destructans]